MNLILFVRATVSTKNLMKPHRWLAISVRMLPGIPREVSLRFPCDQAPVDGGYVIFLRDGE
jgi:hypothetical protein